MPTTAIHVQPGEDSINAAYRPVVIILDASAADGIPVPPVVYCDIYFGGVFYKTLSKTQYNKVNPDDSEWQFDIQDAAQEYLKKYLGTNGGAVLLDAAPIITKCFCRLRSSKLDANGFILPDGQPPVQATGSTPAIGGTGLATNTFYILNATLQHDDNQLLANHLNAYKKRSWNAGAYPLTHRPDGYHVSLNDSDYFPVVIPTSICVGSLRIRYRFKGQSTIRQISVDVPQPCNAVISNITVTQVADTQNVVVAWNGSGDITGYVYRVDGGAWISTALTTVAVNSLSLGNHTVDVAGVCQCSQGAAASQSVTIVDPGTFTCSSVVSGLTVTQTGQGEVSYSFSSSGPAIEWRILLDGQRSTAITSTTGQLIDLNMGLHTLKVTPICSNGVAGTQQTASFFVAGVPSIKKVDESSAGPGSIRTQVFEIGSSVLPGNRFLVSVYLHDIIITAVSGDNSNTIATKLRDAVNATTTTEWNDHSAAPPIGTNGYPPSATSAGNQVTITLNWQNSFVYNAYIS